MGLIQVDVEKCKRDGICAEVCPAKLIRLEGDAFPEETADADQRCISCGHCVAACPAEALSHSRVTGCLPFHKDKRISAEALEQFLKMRRSIREFKSAPVPREVLEHAIDTARWAPSASNLQPVRWLVVEKPENVRRLAGQIADVFRPSRESYLKGLVDAWDQGTDLILCNAPHVIVAHASPANVWSPVDCAIAVTYLELSAQADGLGTCWSGFLVFAAGHDRRIAEYLGLPPEHRIFGAVMIGYPKFHYHRIPEKNRAVIDWL
jgi:nitroreductase/NAD-dependent dihydropyrimidine dehydrogenase PreA subunit